MNHCFELYIQLIDKDLSRYSGVGISFVDSSFTTFFHLGYHYTLLLYGETFEIFPNNYFTDKAMATLL